MVGAPESMRRQAAARTVASFSARVRPLSAIENRTSVVDAFPLAERPVGGAERLERIPAPELFGIDPMAPLDVAVLVRPAGLDVPVTDALTLDGQEEGEGKLRSAVHLQLVDGERERPRELAEELEAREHVEPAVQAENPEPGAVIDGGVLVGFRARVLDDLDIDLDRVPPAWPSRTA